VVLILADEMFVGLKLLFDLLLTFLMLGTAVHYARSEYSDRQVGPCRYP